jgi:hypothetical protein
MRESSLMAETKKKPEIFDCDECGKPFPWFDECADFDPNFFTLILSCKTCRAKQALKKTSGDEPQEESA